MLLALEPLESGTVIFQRSNKVRSKHLQTNVDAVLAHALLSADSPVLRLCLGDLDYCSSLYTVPSGVF